MTAKLLFVGVRMRDWSAVAPSPRAVEGEVARIVDRVVGAHFPKSHPVERVQTKYTKDFTSPPKPPEAPEWMHWEGVFVLYRVQEGDIPQEALTEALGRSLWSNAHILVDVHPDVPILDD